MIRRLIVIFSLLIGAAWMGEVLFGNLADTTLLGNFRTVHLQTYREVGRSFVSAAVALTALAGFVAAYRTGNIAEAVFTSITSGLLSGGIVLVAGMAMEVVFHNALKQSPSVLSEFAQSGESNLTQFMYLDALAGTLNHLWIGPFLGFTVGAIGASVGLLARKARSNRGQLRFLGPS